MSILAALGIAAGVGAAARAGAGMYSAAQQFTPEQKARLKKLERMRALNELGLSQEEEERVQRQLLQPIATAQRQGQQQLMQSLAIQDVGAAAPARQIAALESEAAKQRASAMERVQEADRLRAQQQEAEMASLEAKQQARRSGMMTAGLGGVADLTSAAAQHAQARQSAANQEAMMQFLNAKRQSEQQSSAYLSGATADQLLMLKMLMK